MAVAVPVAVPVAGSRNDYGWAKKGELEMESPALEAAAGKPGPKPNQFWKTSSGAAEQQAAGSSENPESKSGFESKLNSMFEHSKIAPTLVHRRAPIHSQST
ncbi:GL22037 [Drosophila persimilis]|uniref:GL22037 n=1 Tax=Drosophila persimilis TaxID=7234 RepID=B4GEM1_DROPE|nr:GL22037 [Drosophila persimilis]